MATGLQDKFSWKEFGTTVVAAGVSEGLQSLPAFKAATNTLAGGNQAVARGLQAAASNVLSQGVDMATGLQKRFDWAGVAVSAIGSAAGYQAGKMLNGTGTFGTNLGMGAANAVASAATRSLLTGNSFGNSLVAELPNAIASTIGNTIAGQMAAAAQAKASAERVQSSFDANGDPLYPVNQPMTVADAQVQRATPLSINPDDFIPLPTMSGLSGATNLAASAGSRANAPGGAPRRSARQSTWADGLTWADGDVSRINPFYKAPVQGPTFHLAPPTWSAVSPQKTTLENRFVGFISDEQATTFGDYVRGGSSEFVEGILGGAVGPEGVVLQDLGAALGAAGRLGSSLLGRLTLGGTAAETAAGDGLVYLRTDTTGALKPYIGQTTEANELARQAAHARAFPNSRFEFTTIESGIPKGSALDIAEHNAIQDLTGGVAARRSPAVSNLRDPVGPLRRPGFGLPEPK
jgi:hypothetical protein